MSKFYGTLSGKARTNATRAGSASSGVQATAASWAGAITVCVSVDHTGQEVFTVTMHPWHGSGDNLLLAAGPIGDASKVRFGKRPPSLRAIVARKRRVERALSRLRVDEVVHLSATRGGAPFCGGEGETNADVDLVTCDECMRTQLARTVEGDAVLTIRRDRSKRREG